MRYWFASSNRDNYEVIRREHIWGIPRRNRSIIERVQPGDAILIYVAQQKVGDGLLPSAIAGAYEVVSRGYEDFTPLFVTPERMGDEVFPYRVKLRPIRHFAHPIEFKPLIPKLSFIRNKTMWTGHIRVAMREIPPEDYQLILSQER